MDTAQEAWDLFCRYLRMKAGDIPQKSQRFPRIPIEQKEKFFAQMAQSINQIGFPVILKQKPFPLVKNEDGSFSRRNGMCTLRWIYDTDNHTFKMDPRTAMIIIYYPKRSPRIISHEFAHIVDFQLNDYSRTDEQEFVASAAGYLFTCKRLGIHSPLRDVRYAIKRGCALAFTGWFEKRIFAVVQEMNRLIPKKEAV